MLAKMYPEENLKIVLITQKDWHPYPTAEEREPWESLLAPVRNAHLVRGEEALNYEWPTILATRYLDFVRDGNRSRHQRISSGRRNNLVNLVIAECMEGKGRFLDDIANGVWAI